MMFGFSSKKPVPQTGQCGGCRFFVFWSGTTVCNRFPPVAVVVAQQPPTISDQPSRDGYRINEIKGCFPSVTALDTCGEFTAKTHA